ncbi:MAG: glycerophosphodiester phosphodiesterase [Bacteroidetes bacterium]|nr:glycerophosphodiester phosphodiesterase [Bacteroidota bacterium]MBL6962796.1 glycerophosphodiester phosphodiesterase [Bacteroidota bacterium]
MLKLNELLIAHRGESFDAPENTLSSIVLAWKRQVKAVEIDIHLTRDNEIVVIHDYDTLRVSGKKKIIKKSSLEELKLLDAGKYKNPVWENVRIPTLKEVLQTVPADGRLIIEIKSDAKILEFLKSDLDQSGLKNSQIEIIAFNAGTLAKAKQMMPDYSLFWLLDLDYFWPHWILQINKKRMINKVKRLHLDGVDVWAGRILDKRFIEAFKNEGLRIYTWTVDNPEKAKSLIENGIDGITTNRAGWMLELLNK